ncbi:hypothetical protein K435DRAFT_938522 [Dendrothele bispora CBS 962.96]|uniref:CCHC-type domain-containing protein n=1 Tax=Dendrothele bispora (strain CBS 962.96) TaxID=1314807 RepID=A0A4V6T500_DENBC|nr:hypothetical protein K435DRAFT_938522 [Dendrothele bispora CBS 962.96]
MVHNTTKFADQDARKTLQNLYEDAGYQQCCFNFFQPFNTHPCTICIRRTSEETDWNAFIGSIDLSSLSDKADPDSSKIIARILEEDRRLREQGITSDTALAAKPRGKVTCYLCGKLGHVIRDCPKKKAFDAFDANSPTTAGLAFTEPDADDDIPYVF